MQEINSESLGSKRKILAKEQVKGLFEKKSPQEASGHNSGPPKQTYYCGSGLVMDYPFEKMFECCFFYWVLIRHPF